LQYHYKTTGVCSRSIDLILEDGVVKNIKFEGGCSGNTQGVAKLALGMKAEDVVERLKGIKCGFKETSCPDQLAIAVKEAMARSVDANKNI
jgi:uncharacterized protein (TIGR03905 family)